MRSRFPLVLVTTLALACGDDGADASTANGTSTSSTSTPGSTGEAASTEASTEAASSSGGAEDGLFRCDEAGKPCDPNAAMPCRPGTECINLWASNPHDEPEYRCAEPCSDSEPCSAGICATKLGFCEADDGGFSQPVALCSGMPMCGGDECDPDVGCGGGLTCLKSGGSVRPPYECRAVCMTVNDCPTSATACTGGFCVNDEPVSLETSDWLADECQ